MSMPPPKASTPRQRVRTGCYTCKIRKVKCKAEDKDNQASLDEGPSCDPCKRLGLECRWSVPLSGEDYSPPPKRRQTIGIRRERAKINRKSPRVSYVEPHGSSQTVESQDDDAATRSNLLRSSEQGSASSAQPASFELDTYVDMLGDLPFDFDLDFDLDIHPVDLSFNGEGLDFAQLPSFNTPFQLSDGDMASQAMSTDVLPTLNNFQTSEESFPYADDERTNAAASGDLSSLGVDEQHLIQHYLATMTGYAKVDDYPRGANNLYTTAFSQSLSFKPLLYAILAFSASHLALENPTYFEKASKFEKLAHDSFEACKRQDSEPDSLLSALLIGQAAETALSEKGQNALNDLFSLAQRIVIRLALLDARASCYRLGGGKLIKALRKIPAMAFIFDHDKNVGSTSNALVSLLRADILRMKVGELDLRLRLQTESEDIISSPVRTEEIRSLHRHIEHEIRQWEHQMSCRGDDLDEITMTESVLEASTYAQYLVMAALHSAVLYLYLLYPLKSIRWEHSVSRVLHCQLKLQQDPSRSNSPSSLIPSSLFLAGICTVDPIHRNWVLERLKKGEKWGTYVGRTRELLESIVKARSTNDELDVCLLMDRLDGRFLI
ncbi:hypothetical protein N7456_003067 [Penicillium angulare]|uniref:Zn(2)-C6 fungal-type domain-containing protein n=1 Tax=Penicillium angulare TaxID=116970 RepID=A0A9W9FU49_9EURO|nr:hypothetical protein N7456_003067 [Penicillium angulare]